MRFWLLHSSEVSIQDQIVAQVSLGILSGELAPGERLPSIRELARRFQIHPNTVSLAYRRLQREHWVATSRGSGIHVRHTTPANQPDYLDALLTSAVQAARTLGLTPEALHQRLAQALAPPRPTALLLFEPDPILARIVLAELTPHLNLPLTTETTLTPAGIPAGTIPLVLPSKADKLRASLPQGAPLHILKIRSVPQSLAQFLPTPIPEAALVAVASHWPPFLDFARTMLIAAGIAPEALLLRNPADPAWLHGLSQTDAVVCDTYTAALLPAALKSIPFALLAEDTIATLRTL